MAKVNKLKGLISLEALRDSLPPGTPVKSLEEYEAVENTAKTFVGVDMGRGPDRSVTMGYVVPANGIPLPIGEIRDIKLRDHKVVGPVHELEPPKPMIRGKKADSIVFDDFPRIDEGQLAGDLLDWLYDRGLLPVSGRDIVRRIQKDFFEERDR